MAKENIIRFNNNPKAAGEPKPVCAAPVDVEMFVEDLQEQMEDYFQQATEYGDKINIVRALAESAATVIHKAGLEPKNFIMDEGSAADFVNDELELEAEDDDEDVPHFNGPAFIMAEDEGEYCAVTGYALKEEGHLQTIVTLFRQDPDGGSVFNVENTSWEPVSLPDKVYKDDLDVIPMGLTDVECDFAEAILERTDGAFNGDVMKKAVESHQALISLYEKTQDYMIFDGIFPNDAGSCTDPSAWNVFLIPRDENRDGIAARYENGHFVVCAYVAPEEFKADCPYSQTGLFGKAAVFDTAEEAAGYLFKACNRYTAYPVYTIPLSRDAFADVDQIDGEVVYDNKNGKLTDQERKAITPFVDMVLARED